MTVELTELWKTRGYDYKLCPEVGLDRDTEEGQRVHLRLGGRKGYQVPNIKSTQWIEDIWDDHLGSRL